MVTCVMSRLAYDNSMAIPPWKKRKRGHVSRVSPTSDVFARRRRNQSLVLSKLNIHSARSHVYVVCVTRCFKYLPCGISLRSGTGGDGTPALL